MRWLVLMGFLGVFITFINGVKGLALAVIILAIVITILIIYYENQYGAKIKTFDPKNPDGPYLGSKPQGEYAYQSNDVVINENFVVPEIDDTNLEGHENIEEVSDSQHKAYASYVQFYIDACESFNKLTARNKLIVVNIFLKNLNRIILKYDGIPNLLASPDNVFIGFFDCLEKNDDDSPLEKIARLLVVESLTLMHFSPNLEHEIIQNNWECFVNLSDSYFSVNEVDFVLNLPPLTLNKDYESVAWPFNTGTRP